jgi:hypothetical protein
LHTTVTVIGWENVTVPAGTFKALNIAVISYNSSARDPRGSRGQTATSVWYAPEVKRFVKVEQIERTGTGGGVRSIVEDSITELLSFKVQ